jgi:hypothetical protein
MALNIHHIIRDEREIPSLRIQKIPPLPSCRQGDVDFLIR